MRGVRIIFAHVRSCVANPLQCGCFGQMSASRWQRHLVVPMGTEEPTWRFAILECRQLATGTARIVPCCAYGQ